MPSKHRSLLMTLLLVAGVILFPTPAHAQEGVLTINGDPIFDPPNHTCYSHFIPPLTVTNRLEGGSFNHVSVYYLKDCTEPAGIVSKGMSYTFPPDVVAVKVHW